MAGLLFLLTDMKSQHCSKPWSLDAFMNTAFLKHTLTFLFLTFLLLPILGQEKVATTKFDTCFSIYSGWFCATMSDTTKYNEKGFNIENEYFYIIKNNNKYYLQKSVEHRRIDTTGDLIFHDHTFENIAFDSINYFPITDSQYIQLRQENIKPFTFEYTNPSNKIVRHDHTGSHPCMIKMTFNLNDNPFEKEFEISSLEQSDTARTTDNKTIISTLDNINYEFNQTLLIVKIYQYIKSMISKFDKENKFVLKK